MTFQLRPGVETFVALLTVEVLDVIFHRDVVLFPFMNRDAGHVMVYFPAYITDELVLARMGRLVFISLLLAVKISGWREITGFLNMLTFAAI